MTWQNHIVHMCNCLKNMTVCNTIFTQMKCSKNESKFFLDRFIFQTPFFTFCCMYTCQCYLIRHGTE
jgi:hypothetical protein